MADIQSDITARPASLFESKQAIIKVIGVGGGGGNAVNHMAKSNLKDVEIIAVNTDTQDLRRNLAMRLVQIGAQLTKGLGVGGDPDKGRKAAEESYEELKSIIAPCDLLFITAGMGGGTGTGAAPYIAKLAKEELGDNILVVGVVTRPFNSEGYRRESLADQGIKEMQRYVDSMIIIPNEKLLANTTSRTSSRAAFEMVDEVLLQAVRGISDVITTSGEQNIDFNDVCKIMQHSQKALIGIGEASGPGRHLEAIKQAISSPLLENADISGSKGFILHFLAADPGLQENMEVLECIRKYASTDSIIKFGCSYDPTMEDRYRVTLIAAGFDSQKASRFIGRPRLLESLAPAGKLNTEDRFADFRPKNDLDVPACLRRKKRV